MKTLKTPATWIGVILVVFIALSCATVNNLAYYDLTGATMALDMLTPPEPTVDVDYSMPSYGDDYVMAFLQISANLVKAGGAEIARGKLVQALSRTDIPGMISYRLLKDTAQTLDTYIVDRTREADVILELEIVDYGIEASSGNGEVTMGIKINACLFHQGDKDIIWQRRISVSEEITPGFFGYNEILGNVVTIGSLSTLSEEQLAEGFERMAFEITGKTVRKLQEDLREARRI
ncbi:MAG: hypothetical protein JW760_08350 [Spirochaetales bacterium]|nr:hypothetical protein [Spirochaetales bacterium]